MKEERIAAIYIRVSTDSQTEYSPDAQLKAIKEYAKRNNIEIDPKYIYKDEGFSGRKAEKRPAFMQMIATAKTKPTAPFNVILVHKLDRFARNREDSIVYKSLLKRECKVEVISITEDFGDDKFSVILEAMLEAMAEYYSLNLSDEVKKGMVEKANRGEYQTKAPFGYKMVDKNLIVDTEASKIVKMIFNDYQNGISFKGIAKKLNNLGIKTSQNNKWEVRTIEYILRNPVYKGYTLWTPNAKSSWDYKFKAKNGILKKGSHESIIEEATFDNIQRQILKKKDLYKSTSTSNFSWISKLVKCSNCGSTLTTQKNALQCIGYSHGSCEESHYISYSKIIPAILNQIQKDYKNPININFSKKKIKNDILDEKDILENNLKNLQEKLVRSKNLYLEGIDTLEEYKENKLQIEKNIKEINEKIDKLPKDKETVKEQNISINAKNVYELLIDEKIDMVKKYTVIHELIDYIVYDKKSETIEIYYKE